MHFRSLIWPEQRFPDSSLTSCASGRLQLQRTGLFAGELSPACRVAVGTENSGFRKLTCNRHFPWIPTKSFDIFLNPLESQRLILQSQISWKHFIPRTQKTWERTNSVNHLHQYRFTTNIVELPKIPRR